MSQNTAVVPFMYESKEVRTIKDENGNPLFVAKDVCDILGIKNVSDALSKIPDNHKGIDSIDTLGGTQKLNVVDEPGLYRLILRSDKPQAEPFMEWVTSEVLPQIRKTGNYRAVKTCKRCAQMLPVDDFGKSAAHPDGLQATCRQCRSEVYYIERKKRREAIEPAQVHHAIPIVEAKQKAQPDLNAAGKFDVLFERIFEAIDDHDLAMKLWDIFHNLSLVFIGRAVEIRRHKNMETTTVNTDEIWARMQWLEMRNRWF